MATPDLSPDLLRSFLAVVDTGSMTRAAERRRLSQSAISLQIRRLEDLLGASLFERSSRALHLTAAGETLLRQGRGLLAHHDSVVAQLCEPDMRGSVRLGTPEDFATAYLPDILANFASAHPNVDLEVSCDLTLPLLDRFAAGEFDLVVVKREPSGGEAGVRVWREPLVWAMRPGFNPDRPGPLPLVLSPYPCVYRARAIGALDGVARDWRVAYTCSALSGSQAAVRAGLGVTVLPRGMVPDDLLALDEAPLLPNLRETEIALQSAKAIPPAAEALREFIIQALEHPAQRSAHGGTRFNPPL
jgi:DNA-binding transcriptional LysR family regulator